MSSEGIVTWHSRQLQHTACSVEACPHPRLGNLVAVASYELLPDTGARLGQVALGVAGPGPEYRHHSALACAGVLDMKWRHGGDSDPVLAVAESSGAVSLLSVHQDEEAVCHLETSHSVTVTSGLCLALEWSRLEDRLAVSDSLGAVTVLALARGTLEVVATLPGHSFEAWTVCFSRHEPSTLYSGGDVCKLNCYDLRTSEQGAVRANKSSHGMGVTSMVSTDSSLLTGSYDHQVREWDLRNIKCEQRSFGVGGGVWRLKPRPEEPGKLLVAAMHDGFKVVDLGDGGRVVQEYREHESLAYGADWVTETSSHCVVTTCSFYDRLWAFPK